MNEPKFKKYINLLIILAGVVSLHLFLTSSLTESNPDSPSFKIFAHVVFAFFAVWVIINSLKEKT